MVSGRVRWIDQFSGTEIIAVKGLRGWDFLQWPRNGRRWLWLPATPELIHKAEALLEADGPSTKL